MTVNVINKPGGSTVPANLEVYKARPDGYTLFADTTSSNITLEHTIKDLPFKAMDRVFVATHSTSPYVITVPPSAPYKTLQDLFDDLKRSPEEFTYVSGGSLTNHDVIFRQAARAMKVDPLKPKPIVIAGAAQAAIVTAQNAVKMGGGTISSQLTAIKSGTIRAVAVCSDQRWDELPDVPTTKELGYPEITYDQWTGIAGPPRMPASVVKVWEGYVQEMLKDATVVAQLRNAGARPYYLGSEAMRKQVQATGDETRELWK